MSKCCKCCQDNNYIVDNLFVRGNLYVQGQLHVLGEAVFNSNVTIHGHLNNQQGQPPLGGSQQCISRITVRGVYNFNLLCNGVEINLTNILNPVLQLIEEGQPISTNMTYTLLNRGTFAVNVLFRNNAYSVGPNQGLVIFRTTGNVEIITF